MTVATLADTAKRLPADSEIARFIAGQRRTDGLTVGDVANFAWAELQVTLAARLKYRRTQERRSFHEVATVAGVSATAIRNWESGGVERPSSLKPDVLQRIADFLHTTPEWLLDGIGTEPTPAATAPVPVGGDDARQILADMERLEDQARVLEDGLRQLKRKFKTLTGA